MNWNEVIEPILRRVEKPGRYVGGEWNEVRKDPQDVAVRVGLVFPDVYEIGMSYLGQKILYGLLNARKDVAAERIFAPWPDLEEELRRRAVPLFTLENKIPIRDLDLIGISLLYELNDSNILTILDVGGIPLLSVERTDRDPLIAAGGPAAFNPEPLADFIDLFVLGDGEEVFPEFVDLHLRLRREGVQRNDRWREYARLPGVYVPRLYRLVPGRSSPFLIPKPQAGAPAVVRKRLVEDFGRSYFPKEIIVPDVQAVFDRVAVEASRGCPHRCRFCQAASIYFPYRVKHPQNLVETTLSSVRNTGFLDASLSALSIGDYPYLEETVRFLMEEFSSQGVGLSLPSLRPRGLNAELTENILRVRKTGLTLVPEAGTERLRRVINKDLDDEDLVRAAETAFARGWKLLKLYFMIGLPEETEEDLNGIVRLVRSILSRGANLLGFPPFIHLSLSSFIPKPHTPFQWAAMEPPQRLREKQMFLLGELKRHRSVAVKVHGVDQSFLEAVFSRGDRRLGSVLKEAWRGGARFDGWKDGAKSEIWKAAFERTAVDPTSYTGALALEAELPWDHIDTGLSKEFLAEEFRRALRGETTPACLEMSCGSCRGCRPEFRPKKTSDEVVWSPSPPDQRGEDPRSPQPVRYRASYSKTGRARYLSHNDLLNVLRRAFRRAGVSVVLSRGFHPKMRMAFLAAMPLGMEGWEEAVEFESDRLIEESSFLKRINASLPEGIRFSGLKRMDGSHPTLGRDAKEFLYSLDLRNPEVQTAIDALGGTRDPSSSVERKIRTAAEALSRGLEGKATVVTVSPDLDKIFFRVSLTSNPPPRIQEAVEKILGLEKASFFLTRERVFYGSN